MSTFKTISSADIKTTRTNLNQLVDFIEEDISGSLTRKKYQVYVTSSAGLAVTSSIFHTVFDQDFTLQTANEIFDMTIGLRSGSATVAGASTGIDVNDKLLFGEESLLMREKVNVYKQFAQLLLGDATSKFTSPFSNPASSGADDIDEALFLCFKRLFVRDGIKRESFAMKLFASSSDASISIGATTLGKQNLEVSAIHPGSGSVILTDVGSATSIERSQFGGDVGNIVLANNTSNSVGLMFYQQGIAVLDMSKVFDGTQVMSGTIRAVGTKDRKNRMDKVGPHPATTNNTNVPGTAPNPAGKVTLSGSLIPHMMVSASIDDILDHLTTSRFGSGSNTFLTFQNNTQINSTLVFCRATADEFNYSSNPTYTDSQGRIIVIDESQQGVQKSFSFVSTVGLYDANEQLLAVAKLSRPVEKNDEKDLTFRVRLDF